MSSMSIVLLILYFMPFNVDSLFLLETNSLRTHIETRQNKTKKKSLNNHDDHIASTYDKSTTKKPSAFMTSFSSGYFFFCFSATPQQQSLHYDYRNSKGNVKKINK